MTPSNDRNSETIIFLILIISPKLSTYQLDYPLVTYFKGHEVMQIIKSPLLNSTKPVWPLKDTYLLLIVA